MFNCLVVEDEPLAAAILEDYIREVPWMVFVGRCSDAIAAGEALRQQAVDVLFLDIHLPGLKGLDFLRTLTHAPQVILTTAYQEHAIESYALGVVDYLLKPIDFERFIKAIQKLKPKPALPASAQERSFRFFNVNKKMVRVWLDEIQYVESLKEYVRLWLSDGKCIATKMPLNELEKALDHLGLLRIHRSFLVALRHIEAYSSTGVQVGGKEIPIGRQYRAAVLSVLDRL